MTYELFYKNGLILYYFEDFFKPLSENGDDIGFRFLFWLGCALIGYLLGSLNFGVLLSKFKGKDVRDSGSGNAGTTNVIRVFGKKAGVFTFIGDFLKTLIACYLAMAVWGVQGAYIAGLFAIIGHAFPIYFKFKGGKGVVCITAVGLVTSPTPIPWVLLVCIAVFVILLLCFKMVSFASIMCMVVYPFVLHTVVRLTNTATSETSGAYMLYAVLMAGLVIFLHRKNLVRIFNHEESKIKLGKKKKGNDNK